MPKLLWMTAAAALACAAPLAAQEAAPADTVRLRFGWAPGMEAEVESEQVRMRSTGERRDSMRIASTHRLRVAPHPRGLAVSYSDARWTELPQEEGIAAEFWHALAETASGGRPELVLSPEGEFVEVQGMEALAADLRAAMQPLMEEIEGAEAEQVRQMLQGILSPEALSASSAEEWNALVGTWIGADLEVGAVYEFEEASELPILPGVEIPFLVEFAAVARVPCTPGESQPRCVQLEMVSVPDEEALAEAIVELGRRFGVPAEEMREVVARMSVETSALLITEPETLRPHLMEITKLVIAGDDEETPAQMEVHRTRYRYPR